MCSDFLLVLCNIIIYNIMWCKNIPFNCKWFYLSFKEKQNQSISNQWPLFLISRVPGGLLWHRRQLWLLPSWSTLISGSVSCRGSLPAQLGLWRWPALHRRDVTWWHSKPRLAPKCTGWRRFWDRTQSTIPSDQQCQLQWARDGWKYCMVGVVGVSGQINRGQNGMWCRTQDWKFNTRNLPNPLRNPTNPTNPTGSVCASFQRCSSEQDDAQGHGIQETKLLRGSNIARMLWSFFAHNLFIYFYRLTNQLQTLEFFPSPSV